MNDLFLSDAAQPVLDSGVTLTDAATGGDETQAGLVPGATYAFTCGPAANSTFIFGVATILTASNILWAATPNETIIIRIPAGVTTLHYESLANGGIGYLRRLAMP